MKRILLILIVSLLFAGITAFTNDESDAQTYLKLYTSVSGTGDNKVENWLLANNGSRRIAVTIEIISNQGRDSDAKEKKIVIVDAKSSRSLGVRTTNGSLPNTVVIIKAVYTPSVGN